jgi:hypothetical protein
MITPKLNINGSSAADLINPRIKAVDHLMDAILALSDTTPHSRDYPSDYTAFLADRELHRARIALIRSLREDIYAEGIAIIKQREPEA